MLNKKNFFIKKKKKKEKERALINIKLGKNNARKKLEKNKNE